MNVLRLFEDIKINPPPSYRRSLKVAGAMSVVEGELTQTPPSDPEGRQSIAKAFWS